MKLVPYNKDDLRIKRSYTDNYKILMEFAESDLDCVKLEGWTQKNAKSAQQSMWNSIRRYHLYGIKVVVRGNNVFLLKVN